MFIKLYLIALPIVFVLDMIWLGIISKNFYREQIGYLMSQNINWWAGISFYLLFIVALIVFVIYPSIEKNSLIQALLLGAFFGFITYATYDLTNLATIKDWPILVTFVDIIWGTVLAATVSTFTFIIATRFLS